MKSNEATYSATGLGFVAHEPVECLVTDFDRREGLGGHLELRTKQSISNRAKTRKLTKNNLQIESREVKLKVRLCSLWYEFTLGMVLWNVLGPKLICEDL